MITFKDLWKDYKKNGSYKNCFYHDNTNCSTKIKKAHSIQKEKVLIQLEGIINGNNLIYSLDSFSEDQFKINGLIPIGKNKASIFTGFCDYHDSKLFSPLENFDFNFSDEQLFLMTYRTFAHGFHQVMEIYNYYTSGKSYLHQYVPRNILEGHIRLSEFRLNRYLKYKLILDNLIETKNYSAIKYHYRVIEPFVPIACSSVLSPFYTYKNKFLNPRKEYSYVVLNVLPNTTRTVILISQFEQDYKGQILFDELVELTDKEFTEAISSLMIYCTTNTFFSPSVWDKFTTGEKKQLFNEIDFCTKRGSGITEFFKSKVNFFQT